ncbi:MAG: prepilin-type N-terminal cleavage/methylation domain-containing protein [Gloeotrichia echinulata DVL01]|jgi:prepilin-type N-terminal cleavage/methylation domain-containing protein|nr:prepilin-type N-terminal cleavage/methylation domain-containing protein [Gloeotrichia echinulata DEX184]
MYNLFFKKILQKISVNILTAKPKDSLYLATNNAGFSLVEILVVLVMLGVLAAISTPNWIAFLNRQQANKANDVVLAGIQEAQRQAKRQKLGYSISFRTDNNIPQIAIYPKDSDPTKLWRNLGTDVGIKSGSIVIGTNLTNINTTTSTTSVTYAAAFNSTAPQTITFDYTGALDLVVKTNTSSLTSVQNDKITSKGLIVAVAVAQSGSPTQATNLKRCVIVKTLLGSIKTGKDTECN